MLQAVLYSLPHVICVDVCFFLCLSMFRLLLFQSTTTVLQYSMIVWWRGKGTIKNIDRFPLPHKHTISFSLLVYMFHVLKQKNKFILTTLYVSFTIYGMVACMYDIFMVLCVITDCLPAYNLCKICFHQNKKLIAKNDWKNIGQRGAKVLNSTLSCVLQWRYGCKSMVDCRNDPCGYVYRIRRRPLFSRYLYWLL